MKALEARAFTLLELLVVAGLISLLCALLLPSLGAARARGQSAKCLHQMRQISMATLMYAEDWGGVLPRSSHSAAAYGVLRWGPALVPYVGAGEYGGSPAALQKLSNGLYRCPRDERRDITWSYGKNVWFELDASETGMAVGLPSGLTYPRVGQVPRAFATVLFGEQRQANASDHIMAQFWSSGGEPEVDRFRHGKAANYAFLDGHASELRFEETYDPSSQRDAWNPGMAR